MVCELCGWLLAKSDIKNSQFWVFHKLQRTAEFHERTDKAPMVFLGMFDFLQIFFFGGIQVRIVNRVFDLFDNRDY